MRKFIQLFFLLTINNVCLSQSYDQIAGMQYDMGQYENALQSFERAEAEDLALNPDLLYKKAMAYRHLNQVENSIYTLDRLIDEAPDYSGAYLDLGDLYRRVGDIASAREMYSEYQKFDAKASSQYLWSIDWAEENSGLESITYTSLDIGINSLANEMYPVNYKDKFVYISRGKEINEQGMAQNVFYSADIISEDNFSKSDVLQSGIKDLKNVAGLSYSPDYNWALLTITTKPNLVDHLSADDKGLRVMLAEVDEDGELGDLRSFPFNGMDYSTGFASILDDGKTVFFACNREGGYGGYDLYVTKFDGYKWSKAQNLGAVVNTPGNDIAPIFKNGKLYFSSNWHFGYGGYDTYSTDILSKLNERKFDAPVNLGLGVNSPSNEYGVNFIKDAMYVTSDKASGYGGADIYLAKKSSGLGGVKSLAVAEKTTLIVEKDAEDMAVSLPSPVSLETENEGDYEEEALDLSGNSLPVAVGIDEYLNPLERDKTKPSDAVIKNMYSVQIAVLSELESSQASKYRESLSDIGQVYKIYFRGEIKIRVGSYENINAAESVLNRIRARGYPEAFVVTEEVIVTSGDPIPGAARNNSQGNVTSTQPVKQFYAIGEGKYKVRLATYSNPKWFDKSKVEQYGNIQRIDREEWTIFLIGDYMDKSTAERARAAAINAGFNQAQIVVLENGVPVRVH